MRTFLEESGLTPKQLAWCGAAAVASLPIIYGLVVLAWLLKP